MLIASARSHELVTHLERKLRPEGRKHPPKLPTLGARVLPGTAVPPFFTLGSQNFKPAFSKAGEVAGDQPHPLVCG